MEELLIRKTNRIDNVRIKNGSLSFTIHVPFCEFAKDEQEELIGSLLRLQRISSQSDTFLQTQIKAAKIERL